MKVRASQINGCAVCLHMHTASARKLGESEERLYLLDAWRESPLYSERERAAPAWTDALTRVSETHAPDDVYRALQAQFTAEEQATLTLLIVAINGWNRIRVGFRADHPVDERREIQPRCRCRLRSAPSQIAASPTERVKSPTRGKWPRRRSSAGLAG